MSEDKRGLINNIWRRESLEHNPYYRTAFHVVGITRDETSLQVIGEYAQDRIAAIERVPGMFEFGNKPLTQANVVDAQQRLFDPNQRILEELLVHNKPSQQPSPMLTSLKEQILATVQLSNKPQISMGFLREIIHDYLQEMQNDITPVHVPPFPVDTSLVPPFGRSDEG